TALAGSGKMAAVPARQLDVRGRPLLVRAYYAVHARLPATRNGLYGRGVIALSRSARERFDAFPTMTADDLFLDSLYTQDERVVVDSATVTVRTPLRTRDLVRRLARVRAGNSAMRQSASEVRRARRFSWLFDVLGEAPWLAPAAVCYVAITTVAALRA